MFFWLWIALRCLLRVLVLPLIILSHKWQMASFDKLPCTRSKKFQTPDTLQRPFLILLTENVNKNKRTHFSKKLFDENFLSVFHFLMPFLVHISDFVTMDIFQVPFHVRSPQGTATSQSFQTDLTNNLTLSNPMKIIPDFRSLGPATRYWLWKREGTNFQGFSVSNYFLKKNTYSFQGNYKHFSRLCSH